MSPFIYAGALKQIEIERVVLIAEEGLLTAVSPLGHMMGNSREERNAQRGAWLHSCASSPELQPNGEIEAQE